MTMTPTPTMTITPTPTPTPTPTTGINYNQQLQQQLQQQIQIKFNPLQDTKVTNVLRADPTGMKILLNTYSFQMALISSNYWQSMTNSNSKLFVDLSPYYNYYDKGMMLKPIGKATGTVTNMLTNPETARVMIKNDNFMKFIFTDFSQEALKVAAFVDYINTIQASSNSPITTFQKLI